MSLVTLDLLTVHFNPWVPPGTGFVMRDASGILVRFYRHFSEYALHNSGAAWHVERERCPTWTDATECRCMLGGDA